MQNTNRKQLCFFTIFAIVTRVSTFLPLLNAIQTHYHHLSRTPCLLLFNVRSTYISPEFSRNHLSHIKWRIISVANALWTFLYKYVHMHTYIYSIIGMLILHFTISKRTPVRYMCRDREIAPFAGRLFPLQPCRRCFFSLIIISPYFYPFIFTLHWSRRFCSAMEFVLFVYPIIYIYNHCTRNVYTYIIYPC